MPVIYLTSGSSWIVPSDCIKIDKAELIGPGAQALAYYSDGEGTYFSGTGGGGGAYSRGDNIAVAPGSSIPYVIGTPANGYTSFHSNTVLAYGGSGQTGGQASSGIGSIKYSGGNGGAGGASLGGGGGGGAAGPNGNGISGAAAPGYNSPGGGGYGDNYSGGAGGGANSPGGAGAGNGSGGGGGGADNTGTSNGGNGGAYGGGGGGAGLGGSTGAAGAGANGIIKLTYTSYKFVGGNLPMLGM